MDVAPFSSHSGSVSLASGMGLVSQWRKLRHSAAEQALHGHTTSSGRTRSSAGASCHPHASQAQEPRPGPLYTPVGWRVACLASGGPPVPCGIAWSAHCMGAFRILWPLLLFPVALVGRRCPGAVPLGQARVPSLPLRRLSLAPVLSPCFLLLLSWTQVPHPTCGARTRLALGWPGRPGSARACLLGSFLAFLSNTGLLCSRSRTSCSGMAKTRTVEGIPFLIAISSERGHQLQWTCEAQGMGKLQV